MSSEFHGEINHDFAGSNKFPDATTPRDSVLSSFGSLSGTESSLASVPPKYDSISTTLTPLRTISSDKSTIIRLNDELLKSKRSNWEVVDALSKAYQDLRELRMKEQHHSRDSVAQKTKDTLVNDKVLHFQLELMKEDFLKAKANVVSLTDQRDVLRQNLSHAQSELRLLAFDNSRKESELEFARDRIKSVQADVRLKIDRLIQAEQKASLLERGMLLKDKKIEELSSKRKGLEGTVATRDREIEELKAKLDYQEAEKTESELQRSEMRSSKLQRGVMPFVPTERSLKDDQTDDCFQVKEKDPRLAEEQHRMTESLQQLKMKEAEDKKVILDLKAQVRQWERYGARMAKSMNEFVHDTNLRQVQARQEIAEYVKVLEQELQKEKRETPKNGTRDLTRYDSDIPSDEVFLLPTASSRKFVEPYSGSEERLGTSSRFHQAFTSNQDGVGHTYRKKRNAERLDSHNESVTSFESRDATSARKGSRGNLYFPPKEEERMQDVTQPYQASEIFKKKSGFSRPRRSREDSGLGVSLQSRTNSPVDNLVPSVGQLQSSSEELFRVKMKRRSSKGKTKGNYLSNGSQTDEARSSRTTTPLSQSEFSDESTSYPEVMCPPKIAARKINRESHQLGTAANRLTRHQRRAALLLVFRHLTPLELCDLARVCKEWRDLSEEPKLWSTVELKELVISNMALLAISRRCGFLQHLMLKNLKRTDSKTRPGKEENSCYLERGLECILKAAGQSLLSLHIEDCGSLISDRCLVLTGSHCRAVQEVVYISDAFPPCPEALWALWACRQLIQLRVPPMFPCNHPNRFNDKSLETIANCWPNLRRLAVGGPGITTTGLIHLVKGCLRLQELELDRTFAINEETVHSLCLCGLHGLEVMSFSFTPISPAAIKLLFGACPRLEYIAVHIGISDYFSDTDNPENVHKYNQIVGSLKGLTKENKELRRVLRIKADYG